MRLGYIILAHEPFSLIKPLLSALTHYNDDVVCVHIDKSSPNSLDTYNAIKAEFPMVLLAKQEKVTWGENSIVRATINSMFEFTKITQKPDYITLLSGSCFPIKSREQLTSFIFENKQSEFIETHDIEVSKWVINGLEKERWEHYNIFNWRKHPKWFSISHRLQSKLKIKRSIEGIEKYFMGSQWWTLSYDLIEKIVDFSDEHVLKYLDKTWIPDEFYIQTMAKNLSESSVPFKEPLMKYEFNSLGIPKVYEYDDLSKLNNLNGKFFARKINHNNVLLKRNLMSIYTGELNFERAENINEFNWYKRNNIEGCFSQYDKPVIILIYDGDLSQNILASFSHISQDFSLYGYLFSKDNIDYGLEKENKLFRSNVILRDYSWNAFIHSIGFNSKKGFLFFLNSYDLCNVSYLFNDNPNVRYCEVLSEGNKEYDKLKFKLEYDNINLSRIGCIDINDVSGFVNKLVNLFKYYD